LKIDTIHTYLNKCAEAMAFLVKITLWMVPALKVKY